MSLTAITLPCLNGVHNVATINPKRGTLYKTSNIFSQTDFNITVKCVPYCQDIAIIITPPPNIRHNMAAEKHEFYADIA